MTLFLGLVALSHSRCNINRDGGNILEKVLTFVEIGSSSRISLFVC